MTDTPPDPPEQTDDDRTRVELVAETVGRDLLLVLVGELKQQKRVYADLTEDQQNSAIMRLTALIRQGLARGFSLMVGGGFPHAAATLEKVAFTVKGVQGTLTLAPASEYRHALSDHAGHGVIVVLASADKYLQRMEEVRAEPDQRQLELPTDTSGYDQERHDEPDETAAPPLPPIGPAPDMHPGPLTVEAVADALALAGIDATPGAIETWTQEDRKLAVDFCAAVALKEQGGDVVVPPRPWMLGGGDGEDE